MDKDNYILINVETNITYILKLYYTQVSQLVVLN